MPINHRCDELVISWNQHWTAADEAYRHGDVDGYIDNIHMYHLLVSIGEDNGCVDSPL